MTILTMEHLSRYVGILGHFAYLYGVASLVERNRIFKGETEYLTAKMQDIEREFSSIQVLQGKKRKRDNDLCLTNWVAEGHKLAEKAQDLLREDGRWRCLIMGAKMRWDVGNVVDDLRNHVKKGDLLLEEALFEARGLCPGYHIPVKELVGQVASETLNQLKDTLEGDKFGRIVIHGKKGNGKTFLMKHLHNYALDCFDYVFWIPSPDEFTIDGVQDAVASVVDCYFGSYDDLDKRTDKLSQKLEDLGNFALFLDGVPKVDNLLDKVGIAVPAKGGKCKLVLSTNSTLVGRESDGFAAFEVVRLLGEEAYQLFMHEARIGEGPDSSVDDMARALADTCHGVPHEIVHLATCMCGKDDPHEWRYALCERESKRLKKDMTLSMSSLSSLGENEKSSSAHRS